MIRVKISEELGMLNNMGSQSDLIPVKTAIKNFDDQKGLNLEIGLAATVPIKEKKTRKSGGKNSSRKNAPKNNNHNNHLGSLTTDSKEDEEDCSSDHLLEGKEGDADVAITYDSQVDEMLA